MATVTHSSPASFPDVPATDWRSVAPDLEVAPMQSGAPAAGMRVWQQLPEYADTGVYHALYLPSDWSAQAPRRFPLLVEYAGNGDYADAYGDTCSGRVEDCNLGYGLSAGQGFLWLCLPFVNSATRSNEKLWWGDAGATAAYCRQAVHAVCRDFYADPNAVILTGFSRGAIACSYLGLRDESIADLWLGLLAYSHFDGVRRWPYADSDPASAAARLRRLRGRACLICDEAGTAATEAFVASTQVQAPFTFLRTPFRNHSDRWALRDTPARVAARRWLAEVLETRPGTHTIRGRITDRGGRGVAGVRLDSGPTHFAYTDSVGHYSLPGLIDSARVLQPLKRGRTFTPARCELRIDGADVVGVNFTAL
jgi:hypothetical protein